MRPLMLSMLASCARAARAMSTTQQPFVSAIESIAKPTAQTAKAWLQASPSGAYTTARTHAGKVFEWSAHVQRTAEADEASMEERPPKHLWHALSHAPCRVCASAGLLRHKRARVQKPTRRGAAFFARPSAGATDDAASHAV